MRAVTIQDGATVEIDSDDLLFRRLVKSVEMTSPCPCCGKRSTKFVSCNQYGFGGDPAYGSFRASACDERAQALIGHTAFRGMLVQVEALGQRHWQTYRDGVLVNESFGQ
jgi:hypothetical protein